MFTITKKERDYLESHGCKFGDQLHKTRGGGRKCTYFATEEKEVFNLLNEYRKSIQLKNAKEVI